MERGKTHMQLRAVVAVLNVALATVFLSSGHLLVGLLFGALAVVNVTFVVTMRRRRAAMRERLTAWVDRGGQGAPGSAPPHRVPPLGPPPGASQ